MCRKPTHPGHDQDLWGIRAVRPARSAVVPFVARNRATSTPPQGARDPSAPNAGDYTRAACAQQPTAKPKRRWLRAILIFVAGLVLGGLSAHGTGSAQASAAPQPAAARGQAAHDRGSVVPPTVFLVFMERVEAACPRKQGRVPTRPAR